MSLEFGGYHRSRLSWTDIKWHKYSYQLFIL